MASDVWNLEQSPTSSTVDYSRCEKECLVQQPRFPCGIEKAQVCSVKLHYMLPHIRKHEVVEQLNLELEYLTYFYEFDNQP